MELGTPLGRRKAVLREQHRIVEIDRFIEQARSGINIDHLDIFIHRPFTQRCFPALFPRQFDDRIINYCSRK